MGISSPAPVAAGVRFPSLFGSHCPWCSVLVWGPPLSVGGPQDTVRVCGECRGAWTWEVVPGRGRCALPQGGGVRSWASGQRQAAQEDVGSDPCASSQLGGGDRRVLPTSGTGGGFSTSGATGRSRLVPRWLSRGQGSCVLHRAELEGSHSSEACASLGGPGFLLDSLSCVVPAL